MFKVKYVIVCVYKRYNRIYIIMFDSGGGHFDEFVSRFELKG